jgi:hypothetical protein
MSFVAITVHYIDNQWTLQQPLLAFKVLEGKHTGYNMACTVRDTLEEFDIIQKLYCITTDNAKNNIKMAEHLAKMLAIEDVEWDPTINHVRCLTHIINLVVQEFLDTLQIASPAGNEITTSFRSTLLKVRKIAKSIRSSPQRWEVFQRACRAFEIKPITIPLDVPTRWDSGYDMLEPFIYLRRPILSSCTLAPW